MDTPGLDIKQLRARAESWAAGFAAANPGRGERVSLVPLHPGEPGPPRPPADRPAPAAARAGRRQAIADVGGADGALAFFLEGLGHQVDILDYGPTNFNTLRGARLLKETLKSGVTIDEVDLDSQFQLPRTDYGLVFFLGILYHFKNPCFALESFARATRYLLISIRVAKFAGRKKTEIAGLPVAQSGGPGRDQQRRHQLLDLLAGRPAEDHPPDRLGGPRLHHRRRHAKFGPRTPARDERAFCLLESRRFL
jgi:tRNA (mo5U34)-methyltransferase